MIRLLVGMTLTLLGCDTFRSIEAVSEPGPSDTSMRSDATGGFADGGATLDATRDAATDTRVPSDLSGDVTTDTPTDVRADVDADGGSDVGPPVGCPRTSPQRPAWADGSISVPKASVLENSVYPRVSIGANGPSGPNAAGKFALAFRSDVGAPRGRIYVFESDSVAAAKTMTIAQPVIEPWTDIAVAGTADPDQFAFMAIGESPACDVSGELAWQGTVDDSQTDLAVVNASTITDNCGTFRPRVAVTGPFGTPPNFRLTSTTGSSETLAFPGRRASGGGNGLVAQVSASSKDLVAVSTSTTDSWFAWFPGRPGEGSSVIDLDGFGDLDVDWLFDDCYVAVTRRADFLKMASLDCEAACDVQQLIDFDAGEQLARTDVTRIPGGGFVVVAAVGLPQARLVAYFYDDGFNPMPVNGATSFEMVDTNRLVPDLAISATEDGGDLVLAAVYTTAQFAGQPVVDAISVVTMRITP